MKIIRLAFIFLLIFPIMACSKKKMNKEAEKILKGLSIEQKIGQMLITAVPGNKINSNIKNIIDKYKPGGIILFGYNLSADVDSALFIADMQNYSFNSNGLPLFVSIDQEGGRVIRIRRGVTQFPGNMAAGMANREDLVYNWGRILGIELLQKGVNMNLAPILDVNNNLYNPVINIRSFGSDVNIVSKLGSAYIKGLQDSNCIAVGKHFPGHGDTNKDSHLTLPVIKYDMNRLRKIEFPPFIKAINSDVEAIMTAHISFPVILGNNDSATISKKFLTDVLRKEMKFKGLVMTDDMEMNAISKKLNIGEAAVKSINSGADIILITSYSKSIKKIISTMKKSIEDGSLSIARIDQSVKRILEVKLRYNICSIEKNEEKNKKKKLVMKLYQPSKKERKILNSADSVNEALSREAIFYKGEVPFLPEEKSLKIIITGEKILRDNIIVKENIHIVKRLNSALNNLLKNSILKKKYIYYHTGKFNKWKFIKLLSVAKKQNANLILISTGNPFPVITSGVVTNYLFSFSNTEESYRQVANCLNGEFKPKVNSPIMFDVSK